MTPREAREEYWRLRSQGLTDDQACRQVEIAVAVSASDSELIAAWRDAFGLVVCRNRTRSDIDKVSRFWSLMNARAGIGQDTQADDKNATHA